MKSPHPTSPASRPSSSPLLALPLLVLSLTAAFAPPATALDTLDVKTTGTAEWTVFSNPAFPDRFTAPSPVRDGSLWWNIPGGLVRYDGTTWTRVTLEGGLMADGVTSIAQAQDGALWFAGSHQGKVALARHDGETWRIFTDEKGVAGGIRGPLVIDARGHLWMKGPFGDLQAGVRDRTKGGGGAVRFDGETWRNFRVADGLSHNRLYDLTAGTDW